MTERERQGRLKGVRRGWKWIETRHVSHRSIRYNVLHSAEIGIRMRSGAHGRWNKENGPDKSARIARERRRRDVKSKRGRGCATGYADGISYRCGIARE